MAEMNKNSDDLVSKTWLRSIEPINKAGFMDGAADGQASSFQSSFDVGYKQGLEFGIHLGFEEALHSDQNKESSHKLLSDPRSINCQLCINGTMIQEKIDYLIKTQEEKNNTYISDVGERSQT